MGASVCASIKARTALSSKGSEAEAVASVVKLKAVVELIPAYEPLSLSSNAVASIKT